MKYTIQEERQWRIIALDIVLMGYKIKKNTLISCSLWIRSISKSIEFYGLLQRL